MKFNNETLRAAVEEWLDDESKAEKKYGHISNWDTSEVTYMSEMFYEAKSFNQPLEKWDVGNVTNMSKMFSGATSFNQPLEKWDVSQVTNMEDMFKWARSFTHQVPKKNSENSSTRKMEVYIENLDKKATLERFAKDWDYNEEFVDKIMEELEDSGSWDDGRCEMKMKKKYIEVSIWPDEIETYGYVERSYPNEFLLLSYHIEERDGPEDGYTVLSIANPSELDSSIVFKGGEYDKKSRLNQDELVEFNQSDDTGAGDNGKYGYQRFIKKEDFIKTGWDGVIKTIELDIEKAQAKLASAEKVLKKDQEELMDKSLSLAMLNALGCKNISTLKQKANGIDVWELPKYNNEGWKLKFAVYKSGYVKVITKNSSNAIIANILNDEARYDYLVNHICGKYMKFINM